MTPQEIFEYKQKWLPGTSVIIHSDLRREAVDWCKQNFSKHQWHYGKYTDVYRDTFWFETQEHADQFTKQFSKWCME